MFNNTLLIPASPLFLLIAAVSISYSILRHRLLDIRFIIARSVAYTLLLLVLGLIYVGGLFIVEKFITNTPIEISNTITSIIFALAIALSYQPLQKIFNKLTDRLFYQDIYDPHIIMRRVGKIMSSTLDLSLLVEQILKELLFQTKASFVFLLLIRNDSIIWVKGAGNTMPHPEFNEKDVSFLLHSAASWSSDNIIVFDELKDSPEKKFLQFNNIKLVLPLFVKDEIIGGLLLGEKETGGVYFVEDIDLLKILAPELAIAVRNSLSYEEIKRFNITLKQEVDQATGDLKKVNDRLQQLDKLKDEFVSLASHELRTPMTVIKSYLWLLLENKAGGLTEKQKTYINRAYISTNRLINLVNDMLNVSRIESGRLNLAIKPTNIQSLTHEIMAEMLPKAQEQEITLTLKSSLDKKVDILADQDKIKEVFFNLIGNSLKFTPKGGTITISLSSDNDMVNVAVKDNGAGIKKEDISRLFQKFGTADGNYLRKQNTQGTGLGLYICKSLVQLHGGNIWVESEGEGKGATFIFSLKKAGME